MALAPLYIGPRYRSADPNYLAYRMHGMSLYDRPSEPQKPWSVEYHHRHGIDESGKPFYETTLNAGGGGHSSTNDSDERTLRGSRAFSAAPGSRYGSTIGGSRASYGSRALGAARSHYKDSRISVDTNSLPDGPPRTRMSRPQFHDNEARRGAPNPGVENWIRKSARGSAAPPPPSAYRPPGGGGGGGGGATRGPPPSPSAFARGPPPSRGVSGAPGTRAPSCGPPLTRAPSRGPPPSNMQMVPYKSTRFQRGESRAGARTVFPADSISQVSRRTGR